MEKRASLTILPMSTVKRNNNCIHIFVIKRPAKGIGEPDTTGFDLFFGVGGFDFRKVDLKPVLFGQFCFCLHIFSPDMVPRLTDDFPCKPECRCV